MDVRRRAQIAPDAPPVVSKPVAALLAALGYYIGGRIGFGLIFHPHPISALWAPNAILLAALLLTPTPWWWVILAAVFPAHVLVELQAGVTPPLVLCWFLSNSAEALIGATLLRWLNLGPQWFSSFRRLCLFVAGALVADVVSSFMHAGFALNHWEGVSFWNVWEARLLSNMLAMLTVTPPIVTLASGALSEFRRASLGRYIELGVLLTTLVVVSMGAFVWQAAGPETNSVLLYAPVPFLLWAAVRFGPAGASTSLLIVTLLSIWAAVHGRGPFVTTSAVENARTVQLLFVMMAFALLSLAAVVQERQRAQLVARETRSQLELTLSAAVMGSWEWRIAERAVWLSLETSRALGLSTTALTVPLHQLYRLVHRYDRRRIVSTFSRAAADATPTDIEFRVVRPDGTIRWMHVKGRVIRDWVGSSARMLGLNSDVTERQKAEALRVGQNSVLEMIAVGAPLRSVLNALAVLVESQVDGVLCSVLLPDADALHVWHAATGSLPRSYVAAIDGSAVGPYTATWGAAMYSRLPVTTADVMEDPLWNAFRDLGVVHRLRACWSAPVVSRRGIVLGLFVMYYREPRTPGEAERKLIDSLTPIARVAIERSRADEALMVTQQRYRLATAGGSVGVWDWNVTTNEVYIDPAIRSMLGYEEDDGELPLDGWLPYVHPDDAAAVAALARARIAEGGSHYEIEHRMLHKDGSLRWFQARGTIIRDMEGRAVHVIGTDTDVTERRRARAEVEEQRRQLAHLGRVAMLGELSGALAHELNQPLSAILANAAAAQRYLAKDPPHLDEVQEILQDIVHDDRRASAVINRLRSLLKKGELRLARLDLNEVVADVLVLVHSDLIERRVTLETNLSPGLPAVLGDRVQAQQVLLNLILNASDAMAHNDPQERVVTIATTVRDRHPVLSIADRGAGIPDEIMDRMFEPFFTSKEHGMGLGLAICRSIMRAHGGRLWATNNDGPGATLWVEFSLYEARPHDGQRLAARSVADAPMMESPPSTLTL